MKDHKRWKEIDTLYFIGIILVLIGHSHSSDWSRFDRTPLYYFICFIYFFHMPLYFFISGFLFQNSDRPKNDGYWKWIKAKALRLLTPYLFWSFIAVVPKYWVENKSFGGIEKAILDVFINPRSSVWGHFWFLPVLSLAYAICGAIKKWISDWKGVTVLIIVSAVFYFLPIRTNVLGLSDLHTLLFFFAIGMSANMFLSKKSLIVPKLKGILSVIAITAGCVFLTLQTDNSILGMIVALLMISVCWVVGEVVEVKDWISSHNFTMYIFSWFFQALMMAICEKLDFNWIITFIFMFTTGLIGPVIVILLYEKLPFLHKRGIELILGMREKFYRSLE